MKAQALIDILSKNPELELGTVSIMTNAIGLNEEKKHLLASSFAKVFGIFDKHFWDYSNTADLEHFSPDGSLHVIISSYSKCEVVGKRIIEQPVTDCDIKLGKVKKEDVIFKQVPA